MLDLRVILISGVFRAGEEGRGAMFGFWEGAAQDSEARLICGTYGDFPKVDSNWNEHPTFIRIYLIDRLRDCY